MNLGDRIYIEVKATDAAIEKNQNVKKLTLHVGNNTDPKAYGNTDVTWQAGAAAAQKGGSGRGGKAGQGRKRSVKKFINKVIKELKNQVSVLSI